MNPATREATFAGLRLRVPDGLAERSDTVEVLPSPVPHFPPTREWCRTYGARGTGKGEGEAAGAPRLVLMCWDGSPRDRGPMMAAESWEVKVDGRTARVSLATTFFRSRQDVLVAHLEGPRERPWRYLVYTTDPERVAFERLLAGMRFVPAD